MSALIQAQRAYDNQSDDAGEAWTAQSEAASVRLTALEQDPDAIERALNEIDCDHTDALMALRVQAHLTGNWDALQAEEATLVASVLTKRAKAEVVAEFEGRRARTASAFADRLCRRVSA